MENKSKEFLRAVQKGDIEKLKILQKKYEIKDWSVYRQSILDDSALHIASREGHLEIVKYLCDDQSYPVFKVDVTNKDMKQPLHEAAQFTKSHILEFLIKQGKKIK